MQPMPIRLFMGGKGGDRNWNNVFVHAFINVFDYKKFILLYKTCETVEELMTIFHYERTNQYISRFYIYSNFVYFNNNCN